MAGRLWRWLASVRLTAWLLLLLSVNLAVGSLYLKFNAVVLSSLNRIRVQDWLLQNARSTFPVSWWIWTLGAVLLLLGLNTAACSADRFLELLRQRRSMPSLAFVVSMLPTLIHVSFGVVLLGHVISACGFTELSVDVAPPRQVGIAPDLVVGIGEPRRGFWEFPPVLAGRPRQASVDLAFDTGTRKGSRAVSVAQPVSIGAWTANLQMERKSEGSLKLLLRRDPGIRLIVPGLWATFALLALYFILGRFAPAPRRGPSAP